MGMLPGSEIVDTHQRQETIDQLLRMNFELRAELQAVKDSAIAGFKLDECGNISHGVSVSGKRISLTS